MWKMIVLASAVFLVGACGKKAATTPDDGEEHQEPVGPGDGPTYANDPNQIPAESIDEINNMLARKQNVMARCLGMAVDAKELPKSTKGKVTVAVSIAKDGSPTVKIAQTTIQSETVTNCVMGHIRKITFPTLPKPFETSFTYAFEAS